MNFEQKFIAEIDKYKFISEEMDSDLQRLDDWRNGLTTALNVEPKSDSGLKSSSALSKQVTEVRRQINESMRSWSEAWASREPMKALSDSFGDKAIFLVFGKVNAGKSSFCNFIVERFSGQQKTFQYFHLHDGKIEDSSEPFKEGITETTARIQGVRLGENLVLLDTPGLLSVTPVNHALTQQFLDSADAVLWLSSSSSPGQVQELDHLRQELQSRKPLVPVITKSDIVEDDEIDGKLVSALLNKSGDNRNLQEQDVKKRAIEKLEQAKLDPSLLRTPISVSAHAARVYENEADALTRAGFERLFEQLLKLSEDALQYKRKKAGSMMVSFLDVNVMGALHEKVVPQLNELRRLSVDAVSELDTAESQMASTALMEVISALPGILEKHKASQDVKAVYKCVQKSASAAVNDVLKVALSGYAVKLDKAISRMQPTASIGFEDVEIEVEVATGAAARTAASVAAGAAMGLGGAKAGALAGAVFGPAGALVGGVIGGLAGSLFGGWVGSEGGEAFTNTEIQRRSVGLSYEKLLTAIETDVRNIVPKMVNGSVSQCKQAIHAVEQEVTRLQDIVRDHESQLANMKKEIANDTVQAS